MNFLVIFFIFIFLICNFKVYPKEQSLSSANYSYTLISDSSFFHTTNFEFTNHRRDILYSYLNEQDTAWDYGGSIFYIQGFNTIDNYSGERVLFTIGHKSSPNFYQNISLGINNYYDSFHQKKFIEFVGESKTTFVLSEIFSGFIGVARDSGYIFSLQPGSISDALLVTKLFGLITIRYHEDWMSRFSQDYLLINDGNQKSVSNLSLLYGLSTTTPWIWFGVGLEYTAYSSTTSNYWSPSGYLGYGARTEAEISIIEDFFSISVNFDYNRIYDNDSKAEGNGFNFSTKLTLGNRNDHNASIFYNHIDSSQSGTSWISKELGVSLNLTL